ncbi:MAG TPA: hypothetical protein VEX60_14295 [Pyrinomonadaceae bacterium]|nr:hypothetical protein [Pyrinomonadaceae bacterium]
MGFETSLVDACKEMTSQLNKAEAFPEQEQDCLVHAAVIGCNTLTSLVVNRDFRQTLDDLYKLRRENTVQVREILSNLETFNEFLEVERKILISGGFPEYLASQIVSWSNDVRQDVLERARTPEEIVANVGSLTDQACKLSSDLKQHRQEEQERKRGKRVLRKIKKGIAGSALVGLNATAAIVIGVTTALPTAGGSVLLGGAVFAASGAIGSGIVGSALSEGTANSSSGASASA